MANQYDTNLKLQAIADAITDTGGVVPSLSNVAQDTTLQATNTALGLLAKDNTAQATNTALGLLAKDTTLQATNTALGLLASDNSLQAIADDLETGSDLITALVSIATAISQGGGGGTSNYNDLSNKPSINSTTLSGNKTGAELGLASTADISNINITGSTNTTGSTIGKGVTFYLNGSLCIALTNIASGATFTSGTNYSTITIGEELSSLNSNTVKFIDVSTLLTTLSTQNASYLATVDCIATGYMANTTGDAAILIDNVEVMRTGVPTGVASGYLNAVYLPIKKGQTITTRATFGTYNIKIYAMQ